MCVSGEKEPADFYTFLVHHTEKKDTKDNLVHAKYILPFLTKDRKRTAEIMELVAAKMQHVDTIPACV